MSKTPGAMWYLDGHVFVGQDAARGPWSRDHCHGGPVTGLIARAAEQAVGPDKDIVRLGIDLLRPVPVSGVRVVAKIEKNGRQVSTANIQVIDTDGQICAQATSMHLAEHNLGPVPTTDYPRLRLADATPGKFAEGRALHGKPFFAQFIEVAYPPGHSGSPGPTTMWMKSLPLLEGENMSPFQRLCPLADCGNGISRNAEVDEFQFINPDITIVAHRKSSSEWLASTARSDWQSNGIGLATAVIQDEEGPVATVMQSLVLRRTS